MNVIYNDIYMKIYGSKLNEEITDLSSGNTEVLLKLGTLPMYVPSLDKVMDVDLKTIVNAVNGALGDIASDYRFMYQYIKRSKPMYVLANPMDKNCFHKTMAVDGNGNLWMNVYFIYNNLDCDKNKIRGILFHELMHNFLNHLERSEKVMSVDDRESLYKISPTMFENEMLKQNLCQDYEVNCNMVADNVVSKDFWKELGGMFDEKYFGKMWEEIYYEHGDEILKDYFKFNGKKLPEEYFELVKAILDAMKVLRDPKSSDRDKDIAASKLKDTLSKLYGSKTKKEKMTIRKRLQLLQKTRIKEIGEIGQLLKNVIDDLEVSPRSMTPEDLEKFTTDVENLYDEMMENVSSIAEEFHNSEHVMRKDIKDCMEKLLNGVVTINENKELSKDEIDDISDEIIYAIDRLVADNIKKKEIEKERVEKEKEKEKRRKEEYEKAVEKAKERHILASYRARIDDLKTIHLHKRASGKTSNICEELINILDILLKESSIEKIGEKIKEIGFDKIKETIESLKESLFEDLMKLLKKKVLFDRDEDFLKDICDSFYNDSIDMFKSFEEGLSETEIGSKIKIAISSIRRIGKELHRQSKVRPSKEYKEAYDEEYNKLRKIYMELGEKGLKKELGIS